jgi:acetylornithine deacetylase/succinyl-diaminopimelate desuccinylase-like protein
MKKAVLSLTALSLSLAFAAASSFAADSADEQKLFHDIYKQLIEINTSHSAGDNTEAARAMAQRLKDAGFTDADVQVFEPFPKKGNLVLRFKGSGAKKPMLLLAHLDVVEAKRADWQTDPFKLQENDGYFTARGSIDDKAMASSFVSILGELKREGFKPNRDIILALTSDEERGDEGTNGAAWLVNHKRDLIAADFGINEGGGGELKNGVPNINRIQVAEKVYVTYQFETHNMGGHSSVPRDENAIYQLTDALERLAHYKFPVKMAEVTKVYFARSAPFFTGQQAADMLAVATDNPDPEAVARLSATPSYNALFRTTCVATMLEAGHAENALPQHAKGTVNCRILPHDDVAGVERQLKILAGDKVSVKANLPPTLSPPSPLSPEVLGPVEKITKEMWPGVPVVPAMSTGATDSRFYRNIGMPMYGVSGMFVEPSDARAHGLNERILIKQLYQGREFLYKLVKELAS